MTNDLENLTKRFEAGIKSPKLDPLLRRDIESFWKSYIDGERGGRFLERVDYLVQGKHNLLLKGISTGGFGLYHCQSTYLELLDNLEMDGTFTFKKPGELFLKR